MRCSSSSSSYCPVEGKKMRRSLGRSIAPLTFGLVLAGGLVGCGGVSTTIAAPAPSPTGSVERLAAVFLDTRLEINNNTGGTKLLTLGAGCIDPSMYLPKTLYAGSMVSAVGYCGTSDADVGGKFARGPWSSTTWFEFHAHNPKVGYPSMSIDGTFHAFSVDESCAFNPQGEIFEGTRRADLSGAVNLVLTWVNSTTLASC